MNVLIDTHVLVWGLTEIHRLSARVRQVIDDPEAVVELSAVSLYEIEIKRPQDSLLRRLPDDLQQFTERLNYRWRPVEAADAVLAARLPWHHRDPWDRLILAQAINAGIPLVSADKAFSDYDVDLFW